MKGLRPFKNNPSPLEEKRLKESLRGAKPLSRKNLPLPLGKGKGIKGIGFK